MATKHSDTCLQRVGDDEPIFVLRAQDVSAPATIRYWAIFAEMWGVPNAKIQEALDCASLMEAWAFKHGVKVPD